MEQGHLTKAWLARWLRTEVIWDVPEADKYCETHGPKLLLPETMWDIVERMKYNSTRTERVKRRVRRRLLGNLASKS